MFGFFAVSLRLLFNLTASAIDRVPPGNPTPLRSLNVQTSPSGDTVHDSASDGSTAVESILKRTNVSKTLDVLLTENPSTASCGSSVTASWACAKTNVPPTRPHALVSQEDIGAPTEDIGASNSPTARTATGIARRLARSFKRIPPLESGSGA